MTRLLISPAANEDLLSIQEYITIELSSPKAAKETIGKILGRIKGMVITLLCIAITMIQYILTE